MSWKHPYRSGQSFWVWHQWGVHTPPEHCVGKEVNFLQSSLVSHAFRWQIPPTQISLLEHSSLYLHRDPGDLVSFFASDDFFREHTFFLQTRFFESLSAAPIVRHVSEDLHAIVRHWPARQIVP